jgi:hypothetical protein
MTHQRDGKTHQFDCNACTESFGQDDGEPATFQEVWEAAKTEGWVVFKLGGEWVHYCPECRVRAGD